MQSLIVAFRRRLTLLTLAVLVAGSLLALTLGMPVQVAAATPQASTTHDQVMAILARNIAAGITRTNTVFSGGVYRTTVTFANGATITGCHDGLLQPIPCP